MQSRIDQIIIFALMSGLAMVAFEEESSFKPVNIRMNIIITENCWDTRDACAQLNKLGHPTLCKNSRVSNWRF